MRILSPFSDYYDGLQAQGQDRTRLLLRATSSFQPATEKPGTLPKHLSQAWDVWQAIRPAVLQQVDASAKRAVVVEPGALLVAGVLYPFARVSYTAPSWQVRRPSLPDTPARWCYSLAATQAALGAQASLLEPSPKRGWGRQRPGWSEHFNENRANSLTDWAHEHRVALLAFVGNEELVLNPKLSAFEAARALPPPQAFQVLDQFLGNLAAPEPAPEPLADSFRVLAHGFDSQSFRKPPQPSRAVRRATS